MQLLIIQVFSNGNAGCLLDDVNLVYDNDRLWIQSYENSNDSVSMDPKTHTKNLEVIDRK